MVGWKKIQIPPSPYILTCPLKTEKNNKKNVHPVLEDERFVISALFCSDHFWCFTVEEQSVSEAATTTKLSSLAFLSQDKYKV